MQSFAIECQKVGFCMSFLETFLIDFLMNPNHSTKLTLEFRLIIRLPKTVWPLVLLDLDEIKCQTFSNFGNKSFAYHGTGSSLLIFDEKWSQHASTDIFITTYWHSLQDGHEPHWKVRFFDKNAHFWAIIMSWTNWNLKLETEIFTANSSQKNVRNDQFLGTMTS